jgi:hypothetical protein
LIRADVLKYKIGQTAVLGKYKHAAQRQTFTNPLVPSPVPGVSSEASVHATLPLSLPAFWILSWGALGFYVMAGHEQFLLGQTVQWNNC